MQLSPTDWGVLVAFLAANAAIAIYHRKGGKSLEQFFASGRDAPWWITGTSMAATTFAADTPLGLTGLIALHGVSGAWWTWSHGFATLLGVTVFARLWRRTATLTDMELVELRYSGRPAALLRGFRSVYLAVVVNCIVIGWVNLAMVKILTIVLGTDATTALALTFGLMLLTAFASSLAGLRGVLAADFFQFALMLGMSFTLAYFAVQGVGGLGELREQLGAIEGGGGRLDFLPPLNSPWMPMTVFFVYVGVNWWASWKPSGGPDSSGYVAQRMLSSRDERHATLATLLFAILQYSFRMWPWILVALVSLVAFPDLEDPETGYVLAILKFLPDSMRGLMLAALFAAYMSTISTHLNWGAGYLLNDCYRRFVKSDADEKHLLRVSKGITVLLAIASAIVTSYMESISGAWKILVVMGAGSGLVAILRWLWWRVNAWSEIAAMISSAVVACWLLGGLGYRASEPTEFATLMLIAVPTTTSIWIAVTLFTRPEPTEQLCEFYRRARPYRAFWGPIARQEPVAKGERSLRSDLLDWAAAVGFLYSLIFLMGKLLLDPGLDAAALAVGASVCGWRLHQRLGQGAGQAIDGSK